MSDQEQTYGTFSRDGVPDRVAGDAAEAVSLAWDGWKRTDPVDPTQIPSMSGRGSSVAAWQAYAQAHGVALDGASNREDIVAKLNDAGVPTSAA